MKAEREEKGNIHFDLGLGGIFKGIGSLLELASELAEKAPTEIRREVQMGTIGEKGFNAVYGFSVRVGGEGEPTVRHFGNVKEEAQGPVVDNVREPMVDTFDEGEFIQVVMEMPGVDDSDIKYEIKQEILIIKGETGDRKYYKEVLLPSAIDDTKVSHSIKNGILEMKLWKTKT
jgi:HSP20 family protein